MAVDGLRRWPIKLLKGSFDLQAAPRTDRTSFLLENALFFGVHLGRRWESPRRLRLPSWGPYHGQRRGDRPETGAILLVRWGDFDLSGRCSAAKGCRRPVSLVQGLPQQRWGHGMSPVGLCLKCTAPKGQRWLY
uniref:Uncharacterized protein n=1 Tax=Molossus molossus TaxID=27622 RepID=A0A7J8I0P9_MOLMO|nr:hypothetical protein HJG59_010753 [Molossus molossus]